MHVEVVRSVPAEPDAVWAVVADVESWPRRTRSIESLEMDGPLAVGSVATIKQPRLPVSRWRITEVVPGRSFTWISEQTGLRSVAVHQVEPAAAGTTKLTLTLDQEGALRIVAAALGGLTKRYVTMEAEGFAAAAAHGRP